MIWCSWQASPPLIRFVFDICKLQSYRHHSDSRLLPRRKEVR
nr:MAG TPA: hypothetical protein [Caudoviricetes sp.]